MIVIQANTPQEFKSAVVKLLNDLSTSYSSQATITNKKTMKKLYEDRALTINAAATLIQENVRIEPKNG